MLLFSLGQNRGEREGGGVEGEDRLIRLDLRTNTPDYDITYANRVKTVVESLEGHTYANE